MPISRRGINVPPLLMVMKKHRSIADMKLVCAPDRPTLEIKVQHEVNQGWERYGAVRGITVRNRGSWAQTVVKHKRRARRPPAVTSGQL
jgi:hypothetical protein